MKQFLPLPYHAKELIVENNNFYINCTLHDGS